MWYLPDLVCTEVPVVVGISTHPLTWSQLKVNYRHIMWDLERAPGEFIKLYVFSLYSTCWLHVSNYRQ